MYSTHVTNNNNLITIANLCPNLETIKYLNANVSEAEWNEFTLKVGPQLIQCYYCGVRLNWLFTINYVKFLFKQLKNIEILGYRTKDNEEDEKELFGYLNSYENLKSLSWLRQENLYEFDENMISISQRVN